MQGLIYRQSIYKEALYGTGEESGQRRYRDLTFQVKPMNFKHTGLFPEQAVNWDFMAETTNLAQSSTIQRMGASPRPESLAFSRAQATMPLAASTWQTLAPAVRREVYVG